MYDELPLWSAPFGLKLLERITPARGLRILDIGYGTGFPLTEIAMRHGGSNKIYGIDPDPRAQKITLQKLRDFGIRNVELIHGIAEQISLPDHCLDLVVSNNGLNNATDFDRAISECARVLKFGGKLLFTMNLDGSMMEFYTLMEEILKNHDMDLTIRDMRAHIIKKRKPLNDVMEILKKHGLSVSSAETDEFHYTFCDGESLFRHHFIRSAFLPAWEEFVPTRSRRQIFDEVRLKMDEICAKNGFFKLTIPFVLLEAQKDDHE